MYSNAHWLTKISYIDQAHLPITLPPTTRSMCGAFYYLFEKGISDTTVNRFLSRARVTSFPRLPALPPTLIRALRKSSYKNNNTRPQAWD